MKTSDEILDYLAHVLYNRNVTTAGFQIIENDATNVVTCVINPNSDHEDHKRINMEGAE